MCFWWTITVLYTPSEPTVYYFSYLSIVLLLNLIEFIATVYTAIQARKGIHVEWWIFADLTNNFCQPKKNNLTVKLNIILPNENKIKS